MSFRHISANRSSNENSAGVIRPRKFKTDRSKGSSSFSLMISRRNKLHSIFALIFLCSALFLLYTAYLRNSRRSKAHWQRINNKPGQTSLRNKLSTLSSVDTYYNKLEKTQEIKGSFWGGLGNKMGKSLERLRGRTSRNRFAEVDIVESKALDRSGREEEEDAQLESELLLEDALAKLNENVDSHILKAGQEDDDTDMVKSPVKPLQPIHLQKGALSNPSISRWRNGALRTLLSTRNNNNK